MMHTGFMPAKFVEKCNKWPLSLAVSPIWLCKVKSRVVYQNDRIGIRLNDVIFQNLEIAGESFEGFESLFHKAP